MSRKYQFGKKKHPQGKTYEEILEDLRRVIKMAMRVRRKKKGSKNEA